MIARVLFYSGGFNLSAGLMLFQVGGCVRASFLGVS